MQIMLSKHQIHQIKKNDIKFLSIGGEVIMKTVLITGGLGLLDCI